jgi:2-dehydro-3-deoxyphosphogluconate aldolase/(4S)-4-hydroxy-2-oxoglutarate aldolase
MKKEEIILGIKKTGLMAIVRVETVERGYEIAQGCLDGGVNVLEISYTNNNAGEVISALKKKYKEDLLVGAGTVLDGTTARLAIMSGAQFIIAPCYDEGVAQICNLYQIPYAPGCTSYTEMLTALKAGASFIKAFPISNYYGPSLAKVVKVPCPQVRLWHQAELTSTTLQSGLKTELTALAWADYLPKVPQRKLRQTQKSCVIL